MEERELGDIVRVNFKRLREQRGWRQEDLAARMRAVGLDSWRQSTVAQVETCRRPLSLGVLLFLQGVFNLSRTQLFRELLATDADAVKVEGVRLSADEWSPLAEGSPVIVAQPEALYGMLARENARSWARIVERAERYGVSEDDIWKAFVASRNDAEARAARKLNRNPLDVGLASVALWGHSLTEERDRLLVEGPGERVRRSHITRRLAPEIDKAITEAMRRRRKR